MKRTIDNTDNVIDSRDIIARIEELESELQDLIEELENELTLEEFITQNPDNDLAQEYVILAKVARQGEDSTDWSYGETLISEDYFPKYIEELIDDCYDMPKEFNSDSWPWRHMLIDYDAAAEEAKQDYFEIDFDGVTYFIRA